MFRLIKSTHFLVLTWLITLVLVACTPTPGVEVASTGGLRVWLDQPPDGVTIPLAAFTLKAHARNPDGGVAQVEFKVNDVPVGSVDTDSTLDLVYGEVSWNPAAPGRYQIEAWAISPAGQKAGSGIVTVCVDGGDQQCPAMPTQEPDEEAVAGAGGINYFSGDVLVDANRDGVPEGPLDGVLVRTVGCVPEVSTITGGDGRFEFRDLPNGTCLVTVFKPDWERVGTVPAGLRDPINVIIDAANPEIVEAAAFSILMAPVNLQPVSVTPQIITVTPTVQGPTATASATLKPNQPTFTTTFTPTSTFTSIPPTATFTPVPPTATFTPEPPTATPTNTTPADSQGPELSKLAHTDPSYYGACGSNFSITFSATDPSGVSSVQVFYRYEGNGVVGDYLSFPLSGGGDSFSGTIDHNFANAAYSWLQGANGFIRWYVTATDTVGNSSSVVDQVASILYCPG